MRATGIPYWMARTVPAGGFDVREGADRRSDRLRDALQPQRHFGDDAERALRADQEPRQVVAGGGLFGAAAGLMMLPSGSTTVRARTFSRIVP